MVHKLSPTLPFKSKFLTTIFGLKYWELTVIVGVEHATPVVLSIACILYGNIKASSIKYSPTNRIKLTTLFITKIYT